MGYEDSVCFRAEGKDFRVWATFQAGLSGGLEINAWFPTDDRKDDGLIEVLVCLEPESHGWWSRASASFL